AVVGKIGVIDAFGETATAVTDGVVAVADNLIGHHRVGRRGGDAAGAANTRADETLGVLTRAVVRRAALDDRRRGRGLGNARGGRRRIVERRLGRRGGRQQRRAGRRRSRGRRRRGRRRHDRSRRRRRRRRRDRQRRRRLSRRGRGRRRSGRGGLPGE